MLKKVIYSDYIKKYPSIGLLDIMGNEKTSIFYLDYDYAENKYSLILDLFIEQISNYLIDLYGVVNIFLVSDRNSDTLVNRKKKTELELNNVVIKEHVYPIANAEIIKIALVEVSKSKDLILILMTLIEKRTPFFMINMMDSRKIDPQIMEDINLIQCVSGSIPFVKDLSTYLNYLINRNKLIENIFICNGGFDFGQLAFATIPIG